MMTDLPAVPGIETVSPQARRTFARVVESLGWDDAAGDALAAVLSHESRWNPKARNPLSGATGILQFMPATARGMGTSVEAIAAMSVDQQLELVRQLYAHWGPLSARDVPIAPFQPSLVGKPDDFVAFEAGSKGYEQNAGLDIDKDGKIQLGEVRRHVLRLLDAAASKPRVPVSPPVNVPGPDSGQEPTPSAAKRGPGLGLAAAFGCALAFLLRRRVA